MFRDLRFAGCGKFEGVVLGFVVVECMTARSGAVVAELFSRVRYNTRSYAMSLKLSQHSLTVTVNSKLHGHRIDARPR